MKVVLGLRFIERDGKRLLQQRVGDVQVVPAAEPYLSLADDPVWVDVPLADG